MRNPPADTDMKITDADTRSRSRAVWRHGMIVRLWPAAAMAAFCWIGFAAFRVAVLILQREKIADIGGFDIARCLQTGFLYDSVPTAWLLMPLLALALLPSSRWLERRWFRRTVAGYLTFVVTAVIVLETIGTAFFLHFGVRLNLVAVEYLGNPQEILGYIWATYPAWALPLAVVIGVPLVYWLWSRWLWRRPVEDVPAKVRWLALLILIGLCVFASRGWSFRYPLNMGTVYTRVATHTLLCEAARNSAYTLGVAVHASLFVGDEDELSRYPFPPRSQAYATTAGLVFQPGDRTLNSPKNPLWRHANSGSPARPFNVVLILMESMTGPNVGCMGHADGVSPNLDRLAAEGLFFDRCYAVGDRTNRGIVGTLCGFPDISGSSVVKQPRAQGIFLTLPELLTKRGYRTSFFYGGNPVFDNMSAFLAAGGVQEIIAQREITAKGRSSPLTCWGLADEVLLEHAHDVFQSYGNERFFAFVLTVSNHEPFDVPTEGAGLEDSDDFEVKKRNGIAYADYALGKFFEQAKTAAYFNNTLFVLVADHGRYFDREAIIDIEGFRIPFILYGPGLTGEDGQPLITPGRVNTVCSQTDVAPTVLGRLGGAFEHCFMGRDLLRADLDPDSGFALLHEGERLAFVTARDGVMLPPNRAPLYVTLDDAGEVAHPPPAEPNKARSDELTHRLLSVYRTALDLYLTRSYGPQARE